MISIIVARDKTRVIGKSNDLPWNIPADMKHFREVTTGNVVVMGRATYESIGKALPNRKNVVITGKQDYKDEENLFFKNNYDEAIIFASHIAAEDNCDVYVIGGSSVYAEAINDPRVEELLITVINHEFDGDRYFPFTSPKDWELAEFKKYLPDPDDSKNHYELAFMRYSRRKSGEMAKDIFYYPSSRSAEQTKKMQDIESLGICPFCPEWFDWFHDSAFQKSDGSFNFEHWIVSPNDNPYKGTVRDILLISKIHTIKFSDLPVEAQSEFGLVISEIAKRFTLFNYAVGMRVGPASMVGGSVNHLHAHLKVGDVYDESHKPIKFKMSNKPQANKPPESY
jgi:dihydrofolate reductase